jgi:signal transduction histidine kinase
MGDGSPKAKILLVDDKRQNLYALGAILEGDAYEILTASSGAEALRVLLRTDVAVVLLDVIMPDMDGYEVARHLKTIGRTSKIPIIFVTASALDIHHAYRAYEVGAVDYLIKPLDPETVRKKVAVFVELVHQREEIDRQARLLRETERREHELRVAELRMAAHEELLAVVSHDLRTPLASILLRAEQIERNVASDAPQLERLGESARSIVRSAADMSRLIGSLLDFALLRAGRLSLELHPVDLKELVAETFETFKPLAAEKEIELGASAGSSLPVRGDRGRLLQAFHNLAGNAIKFTPQGGHVAIRAESDAAGVRVTIADSGPGIAEDDIPHIWDRFIHATRSEGGGTGLGLSITKGIVEAHGGRVGVESAIGVGTTFWFTLPREGPPSAPAAPA